MEQFREMTKSPVEYPEVFLSAIERYCSVWKKEVPLEPLKRAYPAKLSGLWEEIFSLSEQVMDAYDRNVLQAVLEAFAATRLREREIGKREKTGCVLAAELIWAAYQKDTDVFWGLSKLYAPRAVYDFICNYIWGTDTDYEGSFGSSYFYVIHDPDE